MRARRFPISDPVDEVSQGTRSVWPVAVTVSRTTVGSVLTESGPGKGGCSSKCNGAATCFSVGGAGMGWRAFQIRSANPRARRPIAPATVHQIQRRSPDVAGAGRASAVAVARLLEGEIAVEEEGA